MKLVWFHEFGHYSGLWLAVGRSRGLWAGFVLCRTEVAMTFATWTVRLQYCPHF